MGCETERLVGFAAFGEHCLVCTLPDHCLLVTTELCVRPASPCYLYLCIAVVITTDNSAYTSLLQSDSGLTALLLLQVQLSGRQNPSKTNVQTMWCKIPLTS